MRLAAKIAFLLIAGLTALLWVYGLNRVEEVRDRRESDIRQDERAVGRLFRPGFERAWRKEGKFSALYLLEYMKETLSDQELAIKFDLRYVSLSESQEGHAPAVDRAELGPVTRGEELSIKRTDDSGESRLYTYVPLSLGGGAPPGALEVSESLNPVRQLYEEDRDEVVQGLLLLAALSTGLVLLVGAWMVARPMHRLVAAARRMGEGDLSTEVKLRRRDEIGLLASEMDRTREKLLRARQELEEETERRIKALDQLRHADRLSTVGELAAGVAHELGTPLAVVSGRSQLIANRTVEGDKAVEYGASIFRQSQRMENIVRNLLDFARKRKPTPTALDMGRLAETTINLLQSMAKKHRVELRLEKPEDTPRVQVDANQMEQVLSNLAVNALQVTPEGGEVTIRIDETRASPPADHGGEEGTFLRIAVEDQGEGIEEEVRDRIFEPFVTTKGVGEGTGLGLAIAYGIVKEHGGWIDAESVPGEGARFSIYLPAGALAPGAEPA